MNPSASGPPAGPSVALAAQRADEHGPAEALAPPAPEQRREALRVEFTAPGGTRIIWTLNPALELRAGVTVDG